MPTSLAIADLEAYRAECRRGIAGRGPHGIGLFLGLVTVAGCLELAYHPERVRPLAWSLALEVALCIGGLAARRMARFERYIIGIVTCMTIGVALSMTGYMVVVGGNADALAFALVVYLTGVSLLYPWGARGQVPLVLAVFGGYVVALALGVRGDLPMAYGLVSLGGAAATSALGAIMLDAHRREVFLQRLLLARARDEQMAVAHDVTRAVAATLELQEVLWLVCQRVPDALGVDRLWLLWRAEADGPLRGLAAERREGPVAVADLGADASGWGVLCEDAADAAPAVFAVTAEQRAAVGRADLPPVLLRIPLTVQAEAVGTILAAGDVDRFATETNMADFAATLGNSVAMAIANARLHAMVLAHRAELQRLSNKHVDVVEEALRRISRELHDGICQALLAIKLDLTVLQQLVPEALRSAVHDVRAQVIDVAAGVRQLSQLLRPPALDDFGVVAAIEAVAEKYRATAELEIQVIAPDPTIRCTPAIELMLFRTFQEALLNAVKHAEARRLQVRVAVDGDAVLLEIEDDGRGFDAHAYFQRPPASAGLGLLGMRERVAHFGGVFRVTSRPGAGTRLFVSVPIETATSTVAAAS